jgi:hypothetical protein
MEKGQGLIEKLKANLKLNANEMIISLLSSSGRIGLKGIASLIFNVSQDNNCISESLVINEEENSILALAKLGVLKSSK